MKLGSPDAERSACAEEVSAVRARGFAAALAAGLGFAGTSGARGAFLRVRYSRGDMSVSGSAPGVEAYRSRPIYARFFVNRLDSFPGVGEHTGVRTVRAGAPREE